MPLTIWNCVCLLNRRIISVKISLFCQEIIFITEFPCSNFLLPTILTGSKWDFQGANLLLATVNFEPWIHEKNDEGVGENLLGLLFR